MGEDNISLDELIADAKDCLRRTEHSSFDSDPIPTRRRKQKNSGMQKALTVLATVFILLLETVLLLTGALYGVMYVLAKGPSPTARDLFIRSVRETSAVGFLANIYYTEAEIQQLIGSSDIVPDYDETDSSLIQIPQPKPDDDQPDTPETDAWGLTDEDGDGIIVEEVRGEGYYGYMMVVLDPSRVIMGSVPESYGSRGYTVEQMVEKFDAVAGINGGGFHDPDGKGNGSIPDTMVVYDGQIYYPENGTRFGFAGFDSNHILHVGNFTQDQIRERDIQYGVCFGPVLVVNGEAVDASILDSGVNPRTAIGQRSDGAVLMLVINGRQIGSLGATFGDLAEIFLSYGAVNACNLDGGSSSMMWYDGEYINNSASVIGIRPIPTSFLVLKEGENP
ncbi:MAG: phosphodiester glycosidase family protein [Oscillospiraceae bacterium]|nr:phosphodiester glycosidase family protein [Oscillospiraceae bacterium]